MQRRISQLREEEAQLGRLLVTGKIGEEAYDRLRVEWQEKLRNTQRNLRDLERDITLHIDDLDSAVVLLATAYQLYLRLEDKHRNTLLRILAKRIIVDTNGEIIGHELHSPFMYLTSLSPDTQDRQREACGSSIVHSGPFTAEPNETTRTVEPEEFFSMLRFENRHLLAELGIDLAQELKNLI